MRYTALSILSVLVAASAFGYFTYLHTKQTLDYLEGSPTCFPPYVLIYGKENRLGDGTLTTCTSGAGEDGLRNRSVQSTENMREQKGEP